MPYAAKATIEHEFNIDHIDIWITFRLPMKICSDPLNHPTVYDIKPPDSKWIVELDGIVTAISSSDWLDQFTMHLLIESVALPPAELTVEYDSPDFLLRTTWDKQWEPWGKITSTDIDFTLWKAGMIILWSGSIATIPTGWHLCDGNAGTPDLRDLFVACAGGDYDVGTTDPSGQHLHTIAANSHSHTIGIGNAIASGTGKAGATNANAGIFNTNNSQSIPPYYALAYIMKI
jgi:hypothetical protein